MTEKRPMDGSSVAISTNNDLSAAFSEGERRRAVMLEIDYAVLLCQFVKALRSHGLGLVLNARTGSMKIATASAASAQALSRSPC